MSLGKMLLLAGVILLVFIRLAYVPAWMVGVGVVFAWFGLLIWSMDWDWLRFARRFKSNHPQSQAVVERQEPIITGATRIQLELDDLREGHWPPHTARRFG